MPKAAVCRGLNEALTIEDIELEAPRAGEVKVKMGASGVCHSDLSIQNGTLFGSYPIVLGHEGAGVIEEVGEGVDGLAVGDHVVISWVPQCGECFFCQKGQGFLCEAGGLAMATGGLLDGSTRFSKDGAPIMQMACSGTFSDTAVIPAIGAVKIPDDIPLEVAALVGCGVLTGVGAATNTASIQAGDTVVVVGCGGVGLNVIQGALIAGATRVIAVDMLANKLELAKQFGATDIVDASAGDPVAQVLALTENRGADVAFEVIGLKQTIEQTVNMTRRGGEAVLVGVPKMEVMLELPAFFGVVLMSKAIKGCWYGSSNVQEDVPKLLGWYREGKLKLDELISRRIGIDDVNDAFRAMEAGEVARTVINY
ncbi:MAG: Zn-dependent alcohol dehydrogenase [Actinomycetota bacterium]|nr:Zn-dependent alcohol dehydrogenase [Acidimicrobiia bacterium]MDQ3294060.1 Zn-dependent alcohol dehydrogenase [Actinomycetota bacterium]